MKQYSTKRVLTVLIAGACGALAHVAPAAASPAYGPYLTTNYDSTGACTLCHTDNTGGAGTIKRAFGKTLQAKGLLGASNTASLDAAIAALGASDSDGDGATDIDELTGNGDPNDPAVVTGGAEAPEPVEYGCVGGTIAGHTESTSSEALAAAGFVAAALLWSRRRRA